MKTSLSFLLFAALVAIAFAAENNLKPTASLPGPSNVVCAMTVCPTATLSKRELACPSTCKDDCKIIDDQCCPGVQKAVCNNPTSTHLPSGATPSATPTGTPLPSSGASAGSSSSAAAPASSQSSTPDATLPSQAGSNKAVLSTILFMALISVTLLI